MAKKRLRLIAGGGGCLALMAAGYAVAGAPLGGDSDDSARGISKPTFDPQSSAARAAPTVGDLIDQVQVLQRRPSEQMPADLRDALNRARLKSLFAADFSRAHRLTSPAESLTVWLVPGRRSLCLVIAGGTSGGGITCQLAGSDASHLSITRRTGDAGSQQLIGVVPDGVPVIKAHFADGRVVSTAVATNLYVIHDAFDLTGITY